MNHSKKDSNSNKETIIKKITTSDWVGFILFNVVWTGVLGFIFQEKLKGTWAPEIAAETLKKESFINQKREAYFNAMTLANRFYAHKKFVGPEIPHDSIRRNLGEPKPTETEVNTCISKLCLFTDNKEIVTNFIGFFNETEKIDTPTKKLAVFINLLRKDLGYKNSPLDPEKDEYKYVIIYEKALNK